MAKKSKSSLSNEDKLLWKKVTDTVKPRDGVVRPSDDAIFLQAMEHNQTKAPSFDPIWKSPSPLLTTVAAKKTKQPSNTLPLQPFQKRDKSRLARGVIQIDGKLDLHGMNQNEAYRTLHFFIEKAFRRGWKTILVITGKGNTTNTRNNAWVSDMNVYSPGVLRKKVPEWLADGKLRNFIVGFETANPGHGGSGALYVKLRGKNR